MKILLDTNAYAAWKRGHAGMVSCVRDAQLVILSTIVLGELLFGFRHGSRFEQNLKELKAFLECPYTSMVPVGPTTADHFSLIATALRKRGTPIPTNDIWIAAHALETRARLISFDRHFGQIEDLAWACPSL